MQSVAAVAVEQMVAAEILRSYLHLIHQAAAGILWLVAALLLSVQGKMLL